MTQEQKPDEQPKRRSTKLEIGRIAAASMILPDGALVETIHRPALATTGFIKGTGDDWTHERSIKLEGGRLLVPPSPHNNLLRHGALLFAGEPREYETEEALIAEIESYLRRYVDLPPPFEKIAARYALMTWVYDAFNELPYLRFRGDYGSGKTRALVTVGSLCYKAFFASGASTTSPIFHVLDGFGGTLLLDEADFRMSDEKSDLVKILNNGNVKGIPVLRTMPTPDGREFNPRAFSVFGPKIVASRGHFEDRALESRFITAEMGRRGLRGDVPLNLPDTQKEEAAALRNKLLLFRLRNRHLIFVDESLVDPALEPRFNQILVPLLSVTADIDIQREIQLYARSLQNALTTERGESIEGRVLELIAQQRADSDERASRVSDLVTRFAELYGNETDRPMTAKWMGHILRNKLGLQTFRRGGVFYVVLDAPETLSVLFRRYGLPEDAAAASGH